MTERPTPNASATLLERLQRIRCLLLDVDGVLTDGRITFTANGDEIKSFHVRDGSGIKAWQQCGYMVAIISGRESPAVTRRAAELGIDHVWLKQSDKWPPYLALQKQLALTSEEICAMGDDLADLPVLRHCGVSIAAADACADVAASVDYRTAAAGGAGAVREAIEWLLRAQGKWATVLQGLEVRGTIKSR
jgi:3-deoxy-D-manno-octulosonate 8-phosphate phosphatase (KDO 8-P phosphatase)